MTNLVKVTPAEGRTIRQPNRNNRVMPQEGDFVSPDDVFYSRLIGTGDLVVQKAEEPRDEEAADDRSQKAAPAQHAPATPKAK